MNIFVIVQVIKYKNFYLNHLQFSNVPPDATVILKDKMLNENLYNCLTFYTNQTSENHMLQD